MAASVTAAHQWADGSVTQVSVTVDTSYPDALAEAKQTAVTAMCEIVRGIEVDE